MSDNEVAGHLSLPGHRFQQVQITDGARAHLGDTYNINAPFIVGEGFEGTRALALAHKDKHFLEIYDWLSPLRGNFEEKQLDTYNLIGRQDGTGNWLLGTDEFTDWLNGTGKLLWCPGSPGVGKTVLASFIINYIERKFENTDVGIAYIYCNYKEVEKQSPVNLVADLLCQLVLQKSIVLSQLKALHESHTPRKTRPSFGEISKLLQAAVDGFSQVFIIIDALDECPEAGGTRDAFLAEIRTLQPKICLLVTSRHIASIGETLQSTYCLEILASDKDMKKYVEERIFNLSKLQRHVKKDPTLHKTITTTIVTKAKGMFLLARLHLDSLIMKNNIRDIKLALNSLPESLDATYDDAMKIIESQDVDDAELARKVLYWIFYAVRPLTIAEIEHALAINLNDVYFHKDGIPDRTSLVSVCAGLVTIQQERDIISLVHYTTEEYFKRRGVDFFNGANVEIVRNCLTYLSFDEFRRGSWERDEGMYARRLQEYPLLPYAAQHWGEHACGPPEQIIKDLALKYLEQELKLFCSIQIMRFQQHKYLGDDENFPKGVLGLWASSYFGMKETVTLLLDKGAVIDARSVNGETALHAAAWNGQDAVVRLLIAKGADIEAKDGKGLMALHAAAQLGREGVMQLLLENGADVEAKEGCYGQTALHEAANWGQEAVVQLLVKKGADVKARSQSGETALHQAAMSKHKAVVQLLLEKGADVGIKDNEGRTALHQAAGSGYEAVVQLLVEKGADVGIKDNRGQTALYWAAALGHKAVVQLLIKEGADVRVNNTEGHTALHWAAKKGHKAIVQLLVEKGADVGAKNNEGCTVLHWATARGDETVVQLLVEKGADIGIKDNKGQTALYWAAGRGRTAVVQLLVEKGADIGVKDNEGRTALHRAAVGGHEAVVQLLVKRGAEFGAKESSENFLTAAQIHHAV